MTEPGKRQLAPCPRCDGPLDFEFRRDFKDIAFMIINGEWVSLEPFPVEIVCMTCPYREPGTGRDFTIDIQSGVILLGKIDH